MGFRLKLTNKKLDVKFDDIILAETLTVSNSDDQKIQTIPLI